MAMLPQIARLQPGSSGRRRWSLALLGLALLALPTWYETAQSQETVQSQPTNGKPAISKESGSNEVNSKKTANAAPSKAKSLLGKNEDPSRKLVGGGGSPASISNANSSPKKDPPVQAMAAPPEIEFHPQPSQVEQKILDKLSQPVTLDLKHETLAEFFVILAKEYSLNVIVDQEKFEEESITTDVDVGSLAIADISLRSALKLILDRKNLAFYIEDEVVKVTTKTELQGKRLTRTYPVGDLISSYEDLESLVDAIQQVVTPGEWMHDDPSGSQVSIVPNMGSLVVRQTLPGHDETLDLLRSLRKTKAETGIVKGMGARARQAAEPVQSIKASRVGTTGSGFF